jgi:hypothetical protein
MLIDLWPAVHRSVSFGATARVLEVGLRRPLPLLLLRCFLARGDDCGKVRGVGCKYSVILDENLSWWTDCASPRAPGASRGRDFLTVRPHRFLRCLRHDAESRRRGFGPGEGCRRRGVARSGARGLILGAERGGPADGEMLLDLVPRAVAGAGRVVAGVDCSHVRARADVRVAVLAERQ